MILDYVKFKNFPLTADIPLFLIHGNPRNIINEIERDIVIFYKKLGFKSLNYVIDDDTQTEDVKSNLYEQSLFEEKKLIVINIVSKSIPVNMKKLIDVWISQHTEDRIILKLDRQSATFKKTNLYKNISNIACVVEIYELKGQVLERWTVEKCKANNIEFNKDYVKELIDLNLNNSLSISQSIYLKGLVGSNVNSMIESSKYSEYDLIDTLLNKDASGFIKVSDYLREIDTSLSYIIFLVNQELEKLYSIVKPTISKPYIPSFLITKYKNASKKYTLDELLFLLKNIASIDIKSKYMSRKSNPWISFNSLFHNLMSKHVE
mgnify:FL=1